MAKCVKLNLSSLLTFLPIEILCYAVAISTVQDTVCKAYIYV